MTQVPNIISIIMIKYNEFKPCINAFYLIDTYKRSYLNKKNNTIIN